MKRDAIKFVAWLAVGAVSGLVVVYGYIRSLEEGTSDRWTFTMQTHLTCMEELADCKGEPRPRPKDAMEALRHTDDE